MSWLERGVSYGKRWAVMTILCILSALSAGQAEALLCTLQWKDLPARSCVNAVAALCNWDPGQKEEGIKSISLGWQCHRQLHAFCDMN